MMEKDITLFVAKILFNLYLIASGDSCMTISDENVFLGTPLYELSIMETGKKDEIKNYLEENHTMNIDTIYPNIGFTLLQWSIVNGYYSLFTELIDHGADVNLMNLRARTPLYYASEYIDAEGNYDSRFIQYLLLKGANPVIDYHDGCIDYEIDEIGYEPLDKFFIDPLISAATKKDNTYLRVYIEIGNVDPRIVVQDKPLIYYTVKSGNIESTMYLVKDKGVIDQLDTIINYENGETIIDIIKSWNFEVGTKEKDVNEILQIYNNAKFKP